MRANDISWSPIEPTTFALASEDHNVYTFDMRNLSGARQIYKDHVSAVMSVDFSPTGQELVSGSYDRTLRIWTLNKGNHSRDVYHGARMQRIFSTLFTQDARFVVSGSDDGNVRLWKARASEKLGIGSGKERAAREYREQLISRYRNTGDVGRIERQRRMPKAIKNAQGLKRTMLDAQRVKEERRRKHTRVSCSSIGELVIRQGTHFCSNRPERKSRKQLARTPSSPSKSSHPVEVLLHNLYFYYEISTCRPFFTNGRATIHTIRCPRS